MQKPLMLDVVCLCAAWCGTCRDYEMAFRQCLVSMPGHRYHWVDVEDNADLVGDIDITTFPTILLACEGQVLFAGAVLPKLFDLERLLLFFQAPDILPDASASVEMRDLARNLYQSGKSIIQ